MDSRLPFVTTNWLARRSRKRRRQVESITKLLASVPQKLRPGCYVTTWCVPKWVMPMTYKISAGMGGETAVNGISVDEDGDLVLYRKVTLDDYEKHPELIGVDEIWISMRLSLDGD